jgi:hypothetical protein
LPNAASAPATDAKHAVGDQIRQRRFVLLVTAHNGVSTCTPSG